MILPNRYKPNLAVGAWVVAMGKFRVYKPLRFQPSLVVETTFIRRIFGSVTKADDTDSAEDGDNTQTDLEFDPAEYYHDCKSDKSDIGDFNDSESNINDGDLDVADTDDSN